MSQYQSKSLQSSRQLHLWLFTVNSDEYSVCKIFKIYDKIKRRKFF